MRELRELKVALRACADVTRLRILNLLADDDEHSVTDLVSLLRMSQPLVSWHLRILRRCDLIATRRVGRQVRYRINRKGWELFLMRLKSIQERPLADREEFPLLVPALRPGESGQ